MLSKLKLMIDEKNYPYFEDIELLLKLEEGAPLNSIARELCLIKSGIEEIKLGDIIIPSPKNHFLMLANKYRGNYSGTVGRADEQPIL